MSDVQVQSISGPQHNYIKMHATQTEIILEVSIYNPT